MKQFRSLIELMQKRALKIKKRFRLVASAIFLSFLVLISTFFLFEKALLFITIFIVFGYILTYFALLEGVERFEWFSLFFVPIALTISFYLFYFLFPVRWLTRLPFIVLYTISIYAILLCSNIFNVGVEKSLQLYRAAFSINFFYHMVITFLLYNTLLSFRANFLLNTLSVFVIVFLLSFQLIWTVKLDLKVEKTNVLLSFFIALVLAELSVVGSFMPVKPTILALFLTSSYYSMAGLVHNYLDQRLFKETVREYLTVWLVVLAITVLSISW